MFERDVRGQIERRNEWLEYYKRFKYLSQDKVRAGSHPQILLHPPDKTTKSIVLIHGLTDSPHFMRDIADFFHEQLGYNVFLPLLRGHGLKQPKSMIGIRLKHWMANVNFALESAHKCTSFVSIGGLSAGGALSFYTAANSEQVTGSVYLFSAALDIAGGTHGLLGEIAERLLRTPVARIMARLDKHKPLINANPYRYARMDKGGAMQLGRLIKKTDGIIANHRNTNTIFPKRIFAAHTVNDPSAHIDGIRALRKISSPENFTLYKVPEGVRHASLVLKHPIYAEGVSESDDPMEAANPFFDEMMEALAEFEKKDRESVPGAV